MKIVAESSLTSKEQLTLPLSIRRHLGVKAGDSIVWGLDDQGQVIVEAGRPHTLADIRAAVAAARPEVLRSRPATVEGMKAGIATAIRRKHAGR